jgi:hypothetical protein
MRLNDFPSKIMTRLAERAAYLCSNPSCRIITIGPCTTDLAASTKIGVAAHICAASPGGPRYDMSQSLTQRKGIENGIWLCASCSTLIDKNQGSDYPAANLRRWKSDHETLVKQCLEGNRRFIVSAVNGGLDAKRARAVVKFLEQRGALYQPFNIESSQHAVDSLKEIRTYLTQLQAELEDDPMLELIVDSMNHACRHFMNTTSRDAPEAEVFYALEALRKFIGLNLKDLSAKYGVQIGAPLDCLLPN